MRPFRYTLILATASLGAALAAVGGWRYARASAPASGPIIVISVDTLRADHLPAYGYRHVKTPAIDQLAADGVVFERFYSHVPQTLPAHAALLSGRLPFETGVRDDETSAVKREERLLPQMLRDRGYVTAGIVSTSLLGRETGIGQGFEFFDDRMPPHSADVPLAAIRRDGAESELAAERWLDTIGTSRAFLFLHLNEPHKPYAPPDRFSMYAAYDGEIAYADEIVGRLVQYLKSHQLYDRSTIILLSDHGEGLGDHGEQEHGLLVYRESIHVPLIVKQESNAGAGRRVKDVAQHIDLVPTVLDLVKARAPGNLRGRSLKPLLDGDGGLPDRPVYSESRWARTRFGWSALTSMIDSRHQYVEAPDEELYDLIKDPGERVNVAGLDTKALETLKAEVRGLVPSAATKEAPELSFEVPDPDDRIEIVQSYRRAVELAGDRKWSDSIAILQRIVRDHPDLAEAWSRLAAAAARVDRFDAAADAYEQVIRIEPSKPAGFLGAAAAHLKLKRLNDARDHAERGLAVTAPDDARTRAAARELLARIALGRNLPNEAIHEAVLAQQAEPNWPVEAWVEGRIAFDRGEYGDALAFFEQALEGLRRTGGPQIAELHFYAAEAFAKLDRTAEAEFEYGEELREFPQNLRARAGLALLYQLSGRTDEADLVVREMTLASPTPEAQAIAARLSRAWQKSRSKN